MGEDRFLVVHLNAPVDVCRERDQEGLYGKADAGEIANFPGVSSPYEAPVKPDLVLATDELSIDDCVGQIMAMLDARGFLS